MKQSSIVIILQTVRLPHGTEQFVLPYGCKLSRTELQTLLDANCVDASHLVVQPETGRKGTERIIALRSEALSTDDQDRLRNHLRQWLADADEIINEVADAGMSVTGQLLTSRRMAYWQAKAETVVVNQSTASSTADTLSHPSSSRRGKLIAMSLVALLVITVFVSIPPFFKRPTTATVPDEADVPRQAADQAFEGWNLTQSKTFSGASDLLTILRPLIVRPISDKKEAISDEAELAELLDRVNRFRLAQPLEDVNDGAGNVQPNLDKLLYDDALKSYVRNLFPNNGEYNCLALVRGDFTFLGVLLPDKVDAATATTFRTLAHQLIGESAIDETGVKLTELINPFGGLAKDRRSYDAMIDNISPAFRNADAGCTFFTADDCDAAKLIHTYFNDIEFLTGDTLGFEPINPRSDQLEADAVSKNATSRYFARLLRDWQEFKYGQSRANRDTFKSSNTDNE